MSNYASDDPSPSTPLFDETVTTTAVRVAGDSGAPTTGRSAGSARADQAAGTVKDAAGQAKDTAKQAAGQAKDQAQQVGHTAADAGQRVAGTAKEQASNVASDAIGQAKELYGQATSQLSEQAGKQQKNAVSALNTFKDDLSRMQQQHEGGGLASELVQNLSRRAGHVADWLETREPSDVLGEVRQFAARRPGAFIGLAAVAGLLGARAAKALTADAKQHHADSVSSAPAALPRRESEQYGTGTTGSSYGTGTTGSSYGTSYGSATGSTEAPTFGVADGGAR